MEQSKLEAINYFKRGVNENALLYSGNEYVEFVSLESLHQNINGTPFFMTDSLVDGMVSYGGVSYTLPVKFQLLDQKVLINHPVTHTLIELFNERVDYFSIGKHQFYKIPTGLVKLTNSKQIYAERLLEGQISFWKLHDKILKPTKKAEEQTATYTNYDQFAIERSGIWTKIKSEKDVFSFCADKKQQVQDYVKKEAVDFIQNFEFATIKVLKYYDSISN